MSSDANSIIDRLVEVFPACFDRSAPKPLKVGIGPELINLAGGAHPALTDLTDHQIRRALKVYTNASAYQQALVAGGPRYDLSGQPAGEVTPTHQARAQRPRKSKSKKAISGATTPLNQLTALLPEIIAMAIPGKLDLTVKINTLPQAKPASPQTMLFAVQADGRTVLVELKNKAWNNLKTAAENYPQWVAAITGKLGAAIENGFRLDNPTVQVFEKKPKAPAELQAPGPVEPKAPPSAPTEPAPATGRSKLSLKGHS